MRYSRTGIIAVLLGAEVFIGGAILWALGGARGLSMPAGGFHHVSQQGKTFAPIDAGSGPHVVIDDPDSRVVVSASTDGKVHVTDAWRTVGFMWGQASQPALSVQRTADGVRVARPSGGMHFAVFGFDTERTEVALPPGAALDIQSCGGADVRGLNGSIAIQSVDGSIHLTSIDATSLRIASSDGSLRLRDVRAPSVDASTNDGSIKATNLRVGGGTLQSSEGSIELALADANLTVHAQTGDGSIRFNGRKAQQNDDSGTAEYHIGTGAGSLNVATSDGSIHITTNGAL